MGWGMGSRLCFYGQTAFFSLACFSLLALFSRLGHISFTDSYSRVKVYFFGSYNRVRVHFFGFVFRGKVFLLLALVSDSRCVSFTGFGSGSGC